MTAKDLHFLERTLDLAERGRGAATPNPMVGACIVAGQPGRDQGSEQDEPSGRIIGEGWHRSYGGLHAEREALADCAARGEDPRGATMYVSLEPCAHTGRQPPCTQALLEAGLARVVIASDDPSKKTAGRGPALLREAGVEVGFAPPDSSVAQRARLLNQPFRKHAICGRPLVVFKAAVSLDRRVAGPGGRRMQISGSESQALVHRWRAELDAIAVGIETVLSDDPLLTARGVESDLPVRQPLRVVFDSTARLPLDSRLIGSLDSAPLLVIFGADAPAERVEGLRQAGAMLHVTGLRLEKQAGGDAEPERVDLSASLDELGARGVTSLLLEGGPRLAGAMMTAGLIDEIRLFVAPILIGDGPRLFDETTLVGDLETYRTGPLESKVLGEDVLITTRLRTW